MRNIFGKKRSWKTILMPAAICLCALFLWFGAGSQEAEAAKKAALKTPELVSVKLTAQGSSDKAVLQWKAEKGREYRVLRKEAGGKWKTIGGVTASGTTAKYTDTGLNQKKVYIYSVRSREKLKDGTYRFSSYDTEGITTIPGTVTAKVSFENLSAEVQWKALKVSGVSGIRYIVYRGFEGESLRTMGTVNGTSWKDVYHDTFNEAEQAAHMHPNNKYMIDPSRNPIRYSIRPKKTYASGKISYGKYDTYGVFSLTTPVITDVVDNGDFATVIWGTVPYAQTYYVYIGKMTDTGMKWSRKAEAAAVQDELMQADVPVQRGWDYYTVKAVAPCQGKTLISTFETGYSTKDRQYTDKNVLFLGDSIFYGMMYKNLPYNIPERVSSMLGCYVYNGSMPGAGYANSVLNGRGIVKNVLEPIAAGKTPCKAAFNRNGGMNSKLLSEYDMIVLGGGTNDYGYDTPLGTIDTFDPNTFYGALDCIIQRIEEANEIRMAEEKEPIKIMYINLFFRNKYGNFGRLHNGYLTRNKLGLTLDDYNWAIENEMEKFWFTGADTYFFDTSGYVNEQNCSVATGDNLHMTRETYAKIGIDMAAAIRDALNE